MAVRLERFGDREHSVADVVTLSAVVCLDLVTWSYLGGAESVFDLFVGADYEIAVGLVILLVVLGLKPTGVSRSLATRQV